MGMGSSVGERPWKAFRGWAGKGGLAQHRGLSTVCVHTGHSLEQMPGS